MVKALFYMITLLSIGFKQRRKLAIENLALRQQLAVFNRNHNRSIAVSENGSAVLGLGLSNLGKVGG